MQPFAKSCIEFIKADTRNVITALDFFSLFYSYSSYFDDVTIRSKFEAAIKLYGENQQNETFMQFWYGFCKVAFSVPVRSEQELESIEKATANFKIDTLCTNSEEFLTEKRALGKAAYYTTCIAPGKKRELMETVTGKFAKFYAFEANVPRHNLCDIVVITTTT